MKYLGGIAIIIIFLLSSCRKDLEIDRSSDLALNFSSDTVFFDTVFTTIGSTTKRFKIYNRSNRAIEISKIDLPEQTAFAKYRLNVDGLSGNHLRNIEIPANDSIFAFVEISIDPNLSNMPFVVEDSIVFETNGNIQDVSVLAYGQNARFYRDSVITGTVTWTKDLPYVIFGGILIDSLSRLSIDAGCKIYLHKDAIIYAKGTLEVNGTLNDSVTFQGDRREIQYYNEPGQWNAIQFLPGSVNNKINYACIKGSVFGIISGTIPTYGIRPDVTVSNSVIKYSQVTGMFGLAGEIKAYNNLIFACGQYGVLTQYGGNYEFIHNTIALTNFDLSRDNSAVAFTDYIRVNNTPFSNPLTVNFQANIVTGTEQDEYLVELLNTSSAVITENNLLKTTQNWPASNFKNLNPQFKDPSLSLNQNFTENYRLKEGSPARARIPQISNPAVLLQDADGIVRGNPSSIGCYE